MAINPVTNLRAVRVTDESIALTWLDAGTYDGVLIEWQMGGEWVFYGNAGTAQQFNVEVAPNGCYVFRAIPFVGANMGAPAYSNVVYTSPAAPVEITAMRNADASVYVEIDNSAEAFAETLEVQRQLDGESAWEAVDECDPDTQSLTDEPGAGAYWYRCRNVIGELVSAWTYTTEAVSDTVAPGAPSIVSPIDGSIIDYADGIVHVAWRHNSMDGSAQTAAEVSYTLDGETWETAELGTESSFDIPIEENNIEVSIMVRTRGASDDFSAWSPARSVYVKSRPNVSIVSPLGIVPAFPVTFNFNVEDDSGTLAYAIIEIAVRNETLSRVVYGTLASFGATELPLDNEQVYRYTITAVSTSTLSSTVQGQFKTEFNVPAQPRLFVTPSNGAVRIVAQSGGDVPVMTTRLTLARINPDGSRTQLGGTGVSLHIIDYLPPLDVTVEYEVTAYSPTGAQTALKRRVFVDSKGRSYINWGNNWEQFAFCWRHGEFKTGTDGDKQLFSVMGRRAPMVFFGENETVEPEISAEIPITNIGDDDDEHETTAAWRALEKYKGIVCIRLPYEDGFKAFAAIDDLSIEVENEQYRFASLQVKSTEVDYGLA